MRNDSTGPQLAVAETSGSCCGPSCCGGGSGTGAQPEARGSGVRLGLVRPARPADEARVRELLLEADLPADGLGDQFPGVYAVIEAEGAIAGAAGIEIHGAYGLLRSVVVDRAHRGRGAGEVLVHDRLGWARGRGLEAVYLLTTTVPAFFERFGFDRIDRDAAPAPIRASSEFAAVCPDSAVAMALPLSDAGLRATVRAKYGEAAKRASAGAKSSCCGGSAEEVWDPITSDLYETGEKEGLPAEAVLASLGCGNPTALAELREGEVVLDLGSGGGIDVLLSARRVGPTGKAYGLDMTDEMLALARENQRRAGAENVEFLKGEIEAIPLPDASVDVIISNCVINLSADKRRVLDEAFRVLKPGGRFAVSDVVVRGELPPQVRRSMELWVGCVAGALEESEYRGLLQEAGFESVDVEPTRVYGGEDARALLGGSGVDEALADGLDGRVMSAFVRATKPTAVAPVQAAR